MVLTLLRSTVLVYTGKGEKRDNSAGQVLRARKVPLGIDISFAPNRGWSRNVLPVNVSCSDFIAGSIMTL